MTAASLKAVDRLQWLLHNCNAHVELGAARAILELARKYREEESASKGPIDQGQCIVVICDVGRFADELAPWSDG